MGRNGGKSVASIDFEQITNDLLLHNYFYTLKDKHCYNKIIL